MTNKEKAEENRTLFIALNDSRRQRWRKNQQQGYNFSITKDAKSDDGKLKMVWMEKPSWLTLVRFASQVLFYERIRLKKFNSISVKELRVTPTNTKKILIQIDGEHLPLKDDFLKIITLKHALEVIVPVK